MTTVARLLKVDDLHLHHPLQKMRLHYNMCFSKKIIWGALCHGIFSEEVALVKFLGKYNTGSVNEECRPHSRYYPSQSQGVSGIQKTPSKGN